MKRKASISHDEAIIRRIRKDPDFAAEYLKAALEDEDEPRVLLIALRHLAQAQGIAKVAKAAGIECESLYRALSIHGNPRLSDASRRHQGDWAETHSRSRPIKWIKHLAGPWGIDPRLGRAKLLA
jgi:probable addiction module antidote protein